jgi:NADPH-dependent curcumin reductase CurA
MKSQVNRQVRLKSRPTGIPQSDHFEIVTTPLVDLADKQFLVRNEFLSVEPAMRGWVSAVANYSTPVGIGEVMRAFAAGTVVASRHPNYREGDTVMGMLGWQEYAISDGSTITRKVKENDLPLSLSLGVLGLNGVTAYFGLLDVGQPRPGERWLCRPRGGGGFRSGADCQADGVPNCRPDRGSDQKQTMPRRIRVRRSD